MAVKAVCVLNGTVGRYFSDHAKCYIGVNYAALDDSDPAIEGTVYLYGLDPGNLALMLSSIQSQMKTYLTGQGVSFGPLDTVQVLPGAI